MTRYNETAVRRWARDFSHSYKAYIPRTFDLIFCETPVEGKRNRNAHERLIDIVRPDIVYDVESAGRYVLAANRIDLAEKKGLFSDEKDVPAWILERARTYGHNVVGLDAPARAVRVAVAMAERMYGAANLVNASSPLLAGRRVVSEDAQHDFEEMRPHIADDAVAFHITHFFQYIDWQRTVEELSTEKTPLVQLAFLPLGFSQELQEREMKRVFKKADTGLTFLKPLQ